MALPTRVSRGQVTDPFELAQREFDHLLGRFFGGRDMPEAGRLAPYGVDIREDADHFYVDAELPGFTKDEVDITLENQTLTIMAEKKQEPQDQQRGEYLLRERRYQRFSRSFTLPPTVDEAKVDARLHDGVLTLVLNKREESKPRKIQVS